MKPFYTYRVIFLIFISLCLFSCNTVEPPTPLPEYYSIDESPAWSPDGKWIAYYHSNYNREDSLYPTGLYIIDTSGNNRNLVIGGPAYNPDWSPYEAKIVFTTGSIFTIDISTKELNQLTNKGSDFFPSWSPDGTKISFDRSGTSDTVGTWIYNISARTQSRLGIFPQLDWSPTGNRVVYSGKSGNKSSESQIWLANSDGTNQQELTSNNYSYNRYPKWSFNSYKIAWEILISGINNTEIWVMNSDGTRQYYLTEGRYPYWSPDDTRIVYSKPINNKIALFIIDIKTKLIKQITF